MATRNPPLRIGLLLAGLLTWLVPVAPAFAQASEQTQTADAAYWRSALASAPIPAEERGLNPPAQPVSGFPGTIRVPRRDIPLLEGLSIKSASARPIPPPVGGTTPDYSIKLTATGVRGDATLHGSLQQSMYQQLRGFAIPEPACQAPAPYCVRTPGGVGAASDEAFFGLTVQGNPATVLHATRNPDFGESWTVYWYDQAADMSYLFDITGDVAKRIGAAGLSSTNRTYAERLTSLAASFLALRFNGPSPAAPPSHTLPSSPKVSIEGDTNILLAELRQQRIEDGVAKADLVLKNNDHPIWYIVTLTPVGRPLTDAQLPQKVVIPACSSVQVIRLTCEELPVGAVPLGPGNSLALMADGIGIDDQAREQLQVIYGLEVFWRLAFGDPLPSSVAGMVGEAAFAVGDWTEEALATVPVVAWLWKIGGAAKDAANGNILGLITTINSALNNRLIQEWLAERGFHVAGLPALGLAERVIRVWELDLALLIEKWLIPGDTSGFINITISGDAVTAPVQVAMITPPGSRRGSDSALEPCKSLVFVIRFQEPVGSDRVAVELLFGSAGADNDPLWAIVLTRPVGDDGLLSIPTVDQPQIPPAVRTSLSFSDDGRTLSVTTDPLIHSNGLYILSIQDRAAAVNLWSVYSVPNVRCDNASGNNPALERYLPYVTKSYSLNFLDSANVYTFGFIYDSTSPYGLQEQERRARDDARAFIRSKGIDPRTVIIRWYRAASYMPASEDPD